MKYAIILSLWAAADLAFVFLIARRGEFRSVREQNDPRRRNPDWLRGLAERRHVLDVDHGGVSK